MKIVDGYILNRTMTEQSSPSKTQTPLVVIGRPIHQICSNKKQFWLPYRENHVNPKQKPSSS